MSEVGNFMLHSERRAMEREAFDVMMKKKEAEMEGAKRELEMRKRREEEEEVNRLRKEAVPRAQPIRSDSYFIINHGQSDLLKQSLSETTNHLKSVHQRNH